VRVGDALQIAVPRGPERDVAIAVIPARRGPAPEAAASYVETPESIERRRKAAEERAARGSYLPPTAGKPDKRTRRLLLRARQRGISEL
jgi:ribosome-associated heat shock protein Hsp15